MPLTPLGRQLRTVLAGLRDVTYSNSIGKSSGANSSTLSRTATTKIPSAASNCARQCHNAAIRRQSVAASLATADEDPFEEAISVGQDLDRLLATSRLRHAKRARYLQRKAARRKGAPDAAVAYAEAHKSVSRTGVRKRACPKRPAEPAVLVAQVDKLGRETSAKPSRKKTRSFRKKGDGAAITVPHDHDEVTGECEEPAHYHLLDTLKRTSSPRIKADLESAHNRSRSLRKEGDVTAVAVPHDHDDVTGEGVEPGHYRPLNTLVERTSSLHIRVDWKSAHYWPPEPLDLPSDRQVEVPKPELVLGPRPMLDDLDSVLAEHVQSRAPEGSIQSETVYSYCPTRWQVEVLDSTGHSSTDFEKWAKIVLTKDTLGAADHLLKRSRSEGPGSTPLFVFLHLLRRQYVSARALRMLLKYAEASFRARSRLEPNINKTVYLAFRGMIHHARKVWPASLTRITQLLLDNQAPLTFESSLPDPERLQQLTRTLNQALRLLVVPTAIEPIKNSVHQEAALVQVLEFMTSHTPTLQIERPGYRSVVLLQLMQRKTAKEQKWAELKALSWPPWKEERNAVDQFVTASDHGISKAAATLLRMREAGYRPLGWEQTAMVYAGWDVDRTPTIQTLTLLGSHGERFTTGTATWSARIAATRTAQEAWAAFLAYEDELKEKKMTPSDQEVHLAMLQKLHQEDIRRQRGDATRSEQVATAADKMYFKRWRLYPGDVKKVWPLPPSIHLYTYTRSEPPTMNGFYEYMRQQRMEPHDYCLAFVVENSLNLKLGLQYVRESSLGEETANALIDLDHEYDIANVPLPVFTAFIKLLCRNSKVPMTLPDRQSKPAALVLEPRTRPDVLNSRRQTGHTAIVHAIALLQWLRPLSLPPYNAILESLSWESSAQNLRWAESFDVVLERFRIWQLSKGGQQREVSRGAVTAYRLGRRVLALMRDKYLDLDFDGFRACCQITENAAFATWEIMREGEDQKPDPRRPTPWLDEAVIWARSSNYATRLKSDFRILVGDDSDSNATDEGLSEGEEPDTPLDIPNFSLLHKYVRALGWMADYNGLLQTVRWMHAHASELEARLRQDRNGDVMLHRTFCALRSFLERSWLSERQQHAGQAEVVEVETADIEEKRQNEGSRPRPRLARVLRRLRSPAPQEVVGEVRELVESVEYWGGWPSDEDVEQYYRRNNRFARAV